MPLQAGGFDVSANFLDRVILAVAPGAGRKRVQERMRAQTIMNFDAASKGRRTYGWRSTGTSADAALYGQVRHLRNLSRDFLRNRPFAVRAREVVVSNVVGSGIEYSVQHKSKAMRERIESVLKAHLGSPLLDTHEELDLYQMQDVVMSSVFSDGEVLLRRRIRSGRFARGLALPFQIEVLESDYLDDSVTSNGTNEVIGGVEYGPTGAIEAYWLYDHHPGKVGLRNDLKSKRVPWQDIIHVRRIERAGQLRGMPWLAPVMMTLGELSDYQEAEIIKQRMSALMAGVIEWQDGSRPDEAAQGLDRLEPGAIVNAPEGATIKFTEPPSVQGYEAFIRGGLRSVAMGIGITYEALSGDLSGVNFSSARMGRMEMDANVKRWQNHLMIGQFCVGLSRWISEAWRLRSDDLAGVDFALDWTPPRRPLIDPTREIPAMITEIDAGLTSRQRQQRALGYDPDVVRQERREDMEEDAAAGLPEPAPRPGAAPASPGPQPAAPGEPSQDEAADAGDQEIEEGEQ